MDDKTVWAAFLQNSKSSIAVMKSTDFGKTWSGPNIGYVPGYSYLMANGFGLPYGDYLEMDVDSTNSTHIVWGESSSYAGPGNVWTAYNQ